MTATEQRDAGRQTGAISRYLSYDGNVGPLIADNTLTYNHGALASNLPAPDPSELLPTAGLVIRGQEITVESVWDDTDITHILRNTSSTTLSVTNLQTNVIDGTVLDSLPNASIFETSDPRAIKTGMPVRFNGNNLPTGISSTDEYFVVGTIFSGIFQISATVDGTPIGTQGTGAAALEIVPLNSQVQVDNLHTATGPYNSEAVQTKASLSNLKATLRASPQQVPSLTLMIVLVEQYKLLGSQDSPWS